MPPATASPQLPHYQISPTPQASPLLSPLPPLPSSPPRFPLPHIPPCPCPPPHLPFSLPWYCLLTFVFPFPLSHCLSLLTSLPHHSLTLPLHIAPPPLPIPPSGSPVKSPGTRYFFLSKSGIPAPGTFSTITWRATTEPRYQQP